MQSPEIDCEDIDSVLRQALSSYKPGSTRNLQGHGFRRVCLQLFGMGGHGKSSLINSCLCVVNNWPFSNEAGAGTSSESFTTARKEYKLTDMVYMIDNRGLNKMNTDERLELSAQFRNLRTISQVDWNFELERSINQLKDRCDNQSMDFIVPVLVYSSSTERTFSRNIGQFSPFIKDAFEITGIFPIVVLTKQKDPANTLKAIGDLGCQHIFVIDNYTTADPSRSSATDSAVLNFLNTCLQEADRGIQKKQSSNSQWEFFQQATDQIKVEMKRQKELQEEELRSMKQKESDLSRKDAEIYHLKNEVKELTHKLKVASLNTK